MIPLSLLLVLTSAGLLLAGLVKWLAGASVEHTQPLVWASLVVGAVAVAVVVLAVLRRRAAALADVQAQAAAEKERSLHGSSADDAPPAGPGWPQSPPEGRQLQGHSPPDPAGPPGPQHGDWQPPAGPGLGGSWSRTPGDPEASGVQRPAEPPPVADSERWAGFDEPAGQPEGASAPDLPAPPGDEPPAEQADPHDVTLLDLAAAVPVSVVDGRPRYHVADCAHLRGRQTIEVDRAEARQAGFTPCGFCRPESVLATRHRMA